MKKFALYILSLFALWQMNTACKKFLTTEPYNNVSVDDIFKDFEGARTTLTGLYDDLRSSEYYIRNYSIFPELAGGNARYTRTANVILQQSYEFRNDPQTTDLRNYYETAYNTIYGANVVLDNVANISDASALQKNRMLADAYTIRALCHFDLVRVFAQAYNFTPDASHQGIVIKPRNTAVTDITGTKATVKQVYDFINNDLDTAIRLYRNSVPIYAIGDARTFLSEDAAKAIKARVALYQENWAEVIRLSSEVIATNRYVLVSNGNYAAAWRGKIIHPESIFELAFGNRIAESLGTFYNPTFVGTAGGYIAVSTDLRNLFAANDVRGLQGTMFNAVRDGGTFTFTRKYQGINDTANNVKLYRASELWLSRAEAYAKQGNITAALSDLNRIRQRANPTAPAFTTTDAAVLLNEIFDERRRELCFEGHIFFDLVRNKRSIVRADCTGTNCTINYPNPLFANPTPQY